MVTVQGVLVLLIAFLGLLLETSWVEDQLVNVTRLQMFVDELPDMPLLKGFDVVNGVPKPKSLKIGMYMKTWRFHRYLPATPVFAYGTSERTATVPGPTIEALQGIDTFVTWSNYLPSEHILLRKRSLIDSN